MSANQGASYAVTLVASSGIQQNSGKCWLVEAKRLRHIDYLDEVCDDLCPCGIERNMSILSQPYDHIASVDDRRTLAALCLDKSDGRVGLQKLASTLTSFFRSSAGFRLE